MTSRVLKSAAVAALFVRAALQPFQVFAAPGDTVPPVKAETLSKVKFSVPQDFTAARNVLLFSFGRDMQAAVDAWDAALAPTRDGVRVQVYNMPLIPNPGAIVRGFISGGMRGVYEDKAVRERVIVLYVDEKAYFPALKITDRSAPLIVVTDRAGVEIGRVQSVVTESTLAEVRSMAEMASD
ncbi:MAG: hypothetical protein JNK21_02340 [Rhodospirillaceae bacterium]|nr:hypothetical protein [Rhodospirillaceae bacterium]